MPTKSMLYPKIHQTNMTWAPNSSSYCNNERNGQPGWLASDQPINYISVPNKDRARAIYRKKNKGHDCVVYLVKELLLDLLFTGRNSQINQILGLLQGLKDLVQEYGPKKLGQIQGFGPLPVILLIYNNIWQSLLLNPCPFP